MKKRILSFLLCSILILSNTSVSFAIGTTDTQKNTTIDTANVSNEKEREKKYKKYKKINSDTIGWIYVQNTVIDYPVVYSNDNNYYLTHDVNKKSTKAGAIFMDYRNINKNNQRNIVLYGHNMNNGSMFNALNSYKVEQFFTENNLITFYFGKEKRQYEVYASFVADVELPLVQVEFKSDQIFLNYIQNMQSMSYFETKPKTILDIEDEILTLMTCTYEYDDMRYIVQARRVDKINNK